MSCENEITGVVAEKNKKCDEFVTDVSAFDEGCESEKNFTTSNSSCLQNISLDESKIQKNSKMPTRNNNISGQQFEKAFQLANKNVDNKENIVFDGEDSTVSPDLEDSLHPLSERWSPLGANYEDTISVNESEMSPTSEMELLSLGESPKERNLMQIDTADIIRLQSMEEEQELLTSSLLALTSHFAHVQLRVRQIVEAQPDERDKLLNDLNEFAFQGIPDPMTTVAGTSKLAISMEDDVTSSQRQCELIEHLKNQLTELERLAFESGAPVLPQQMLLEKQKVIIDELKHKLNLKVEECDLPQLSSDELKSQVGNAIGEFVGPLKMKDQLVAQLKTQITDLERFIAFLQCDTDDQKIKSLSGSGESQSEAYNSYAAKKKNTSNENKSSRTDEQAAKEEFRTNSLKSPSSTKTDTNAKHVKESLNSKAHGLMDKASFLMQMFATTHFGLQNDLFQKNKLKKTSKGNHWGDLRAQLEVDIQEIASLAATLSFDREKLRNLKRAMKNSQKKSPSEQGTSTVTAVQPTTKNVSGTAEMVARSLKLYTNSSDSDEDTYDCFDWSQNMRKAKYKGDSLNTISRELTTAVRKNFSMTLQRLIQHGLREEPSAATTSLMVPFLRCFNPSHSYRADYNTPQARDFLSPPFFMAYDSAGMPYHNGDLDEDNSNSSVYNLASNGERPMHAWELIMEYYCLKNGEEFNNTPARKLSQSFNLEIIELKSMSAKQNLLTTIGSIIAMHRPYKRSLNAHFKAFVCAGLNAHQLVEWFNLIFGCSDLIETFYDENSYVVRTGFRDSLRSIDVLTKYDFDLPVDLAVRHFKNI